MEVIAIANQKGGSGKTTTAVALAQAAAYRGKHTLLIDLDPQGTASLFTRSNTMKPGAFDLIEKGRPAADLIQHVAAGHDVITASLELQTLTTDKGSARRLNAALIPIRYDYDYIFIDTSPAPGELRLNALMAATKLIIPVQADVGSLQGLYQILDEAKYLQYVNSLLEIRGLVLTNYSGRSTLAKTIREDIIKKAWQLDISFLGEVPQAVAIQEAQAFQQSLYEHAPKSKPALAYLGILDNIKRAIKKD